MLGLFTAATEKLIVQGQATRRRVPCLPTIGQDRAQPCARCGSDLTLRGALGPFRQRLLKPVLRTAETSSVDTLTPRLRCRRKNRA